MQMPSVPESWATEEHCNNRVVDQAAKCLRCIWTGNLRVIIYFWLSGLLAPHIIRK